MCEMDSCGKMLCSTVYQLGILSRPRGVGSEWVGGRLKREGLCN